MSEHVCHCQNCDPDAFPLPPEREGEHHLSTRFGDHARGYHVAVLDASGKELTDCWEVWAVESGTAYCFARNTAGRPHTCARCHKAACSEVRHGTFRVVFEEREASTR